MPYLGQRIVLVCEDEDARLLASALGGGAFESGSPAALPEDADAASAPAILWVRPADLTAPVDRDTFQYRSWLQFWTLYSDRVIMRLFRVTASVKRGSPVSFLSEADAWLESAKEIQSQVRSFATCSVVVFERQPADEELRQLDQRSRTSAIYLMMPRLRVSLMERQQAFSMFIWPSAVGAVLQRLATHPESRRTKGLFAWRSFAVHGEIDFGSYALDATVVDDFIQWLRELEGNEAERVEEASGAKAAAPLGTLLDPGQIVRPSVPAALPADSWFEGLKEWVGDSLARVRRLVKADDIVLATRVEGRDGSGTGPRPGSDDRLASTVEESDRRMLADFRELVASSDREPRAIVDRITDLSRVGREAVGVGLGIRRKAAGMYHSPIEVARREKQWRQVAVETPPRGGPGLLQRIQFSADTQVALTREQEIIARMLSLWERELSRRLRDHETEKRFLSRCADHLALARRSMIALGPRVLLALLSAVMLTATLLQGLRLWLQPQAGLWSGQEVALALVFALMTAAGAVVGACIPYVMELGRGRRAGATLAAESTALVEERIATLNRRLVLSGYAQQVIAPNLAGLGRAQLVSLLAARAWTICQDVFDRGRRQEGGLEPARAAVEEDEADQTGRFSRRAFEQLCVYRVKLAATPKNPAMGGKEEERKLWADHLAAWVQQMPRIDFRFAGWMPREDIVRLLADALRQVRRSRLDVQEPDQLRLSKDTPFLAALERWSPKASRASKNLGMMSLHFVPESGENVSGSGADAFTLAVGRGPRLVEELSDLLRTHCHLECHAQVGGGEALAALSSSLVALVYQETRVRFDSSSKEAESDGFIPVPRENLPDEFPPAAVPA